MRHYNDYFLDEEEEFDDYSDNYENYERIHISLEEGHHDDTYIDGSRSRFDVRNGDIEGIYESWYGNGTKAVECEFLHGKLHGLCKRYNTEGEIIEYRTYDNGTALCGTLIDPLLCNAEEPVLSTGDKLTDDKIARALYVVNKEAKRFRNYLQEGLHRSYTQEMHDVLSELGKVEGPYKVEIGNKLTSTYVISYEEAKDEYYDNLHEVEINEVALEDADEDTDKEELQENIEFYRTLADSAEEVMDRMRERESIDRREALLERKAELYLLKHEVLAKLTTKSGDRFYAIHEFNDGKIRKCYKLGGFSFHGEEIDTVTPPNIGIIPADNMAVNDMTVQDAETILKNFIK